MLLRESLSLKAFETRLGLRRLDILPFYPIKRFGTAPLLFLSYSGKPSQVPNGTGIQSKTSLISDKSDDCSLLLAWLLTVEVD